MLPGLFDGNSCAVVFLVWLDTFEVKGDTVEGRVDDSAKYSEEGTDDDDDDHDEEVSKAGVDSKY